jgi:hypothetical protein
MASECDFGGKSAAAFGGGNTLAHLSSTAHGVELGGDPGLLGGCGGLATLQLSDARDERGLVADGVSNRG